MVMFVSGMAPSSRWACADPLDPLGYVKRVPERLRLIEIGWDPRDMLPSFVAPPLDIQPSPDSTSETSPCPSDAMR